MNGFPNCPILVCKKIPLDCVSMVDAINSRIKNGKKNKTNRKATIKSKNDFQ